MQPTWAHSPLLAVTITTAYGPTGLANVTTHWLPLARKCLAGLKVVLVFSGTNWVTKSPYGETTSRTMSIEFGKSGEHISRYDSSKQEIKVLINSSVGMKEGIRHNPEWNAMYAFLSLRTLMKVPPCTVAMWRETASNVSSPPWGGAQTMLTWAASPPSRQRVGFVLCSLRFACIWLFPAGY